MTCPISRTAFMLMPAFELPTFTDAHTTSVSFSASGNERIRSSSPRVAPLSTSAEYPPMKFTPSSLAARFSASAMRTGLPSTAEAKMPTGVTEMRLFTIGMPSSCSMSRATGTRLRA